MAFLSQTLVAQTVSVAASGTSVAPGTLPGENTHTLIVKNESLVDIYFKFAPAGAALEKISSTVVGPGASVTRGFGTRSMRAGGPDVEVLAFDTDPSGVPSVIRVEYLNAKFN